ncbi:phosphatidate cytidylyltransferase [Candidatus Pelagibacter sp.]|uniref:phosphatidate cytidylyltransferase n=1 Tax=Candidatus Pelagibacter sp. TaxID=2024849 RepID=UPI003F86EE6E|tara:strand:+ start:171 stop:815 length:645 start_codon:yes stop_codon:yes gene_type:complete
MNNELLKRILSSLILIPLVFFFIFKGSYLFIFFILIVYLITLYEWHFLSLKKNYYLPGFVFISFSFYTFYYLRIEGYFYLFLLVILTCISTDIGGYTFGKILKGPKITKISPNKTYSGMLGSFSLSIIFLIILKSNTDLFLLIKNESLAYLNIFILALIISFVSQLGDLIISYFKRKSNIKNTGEILPGHGGLLDRIDGMLFAFPFTYLLIKML